MKKYKIGLVIAMLIWGSIGIFVRYIDFTSSQIALARAIIGSIFLIVFSILSKEKLSKEKIKSNLLILISCGICLAFNWVLLFQSYNYTTIAISTICFTSIQNLPSQTVAIYSYIDPISAIIMSSIILNESMNFIQIFGAILILGSTFISEIYNRKIDSSQIENIEE